MSKPGYLSGVSRRAFLGGSAAVMALGAAPLKAVAAQPSLSTAEIAALAAQSTIDDEAFWRAVRQSVMLDPAIVFLNDGSYSAPPRPVFDALIQYSRLVTTDPSKQGVLSGKCENEVRPKLAAFIGAAPDEVALTRNTTDGMSIVAGGLKIGRGDEVLTTHHEHPGGIEPWRLRAARDGIEVRELTFTNPPDSPEQLLNLFNDAIGPKTKVISFCHMTCTTGLIFPAKEICALARAKGIYSVVDGAHPLGMFPFNLHEIDPDFYANSPHKWLGAPLGNGFLYVRPDKTDHVWPMHGSGGWDGTNARRFECYGTRDWPVTACVGDAIDFQLAVGKERIEQRGRALMTHFKTEVQKIGGVKLWTPMDPRMSCSLSAISIREIPLEKIMAFLREKYAIVSRPVAYDINAVRFSTHYFNTFEEVEIALAGIREIAETGVLEA
jgi:selenocysteine lyase/cysteine desulfurase